MGNLYDEFKRRRQEVSIDNIDNFTQLTFDIVRAMQKACEIAVKLGYVSAIKLHGRPKTNKISTTTTTSSQPIIGGGKNLKRGADTAHIQRGTCYMCGRYEHKGSSGCPLKMHPDVNTDPTLNWADSAAGKAWAQKGYKFIPSSINQGSKERLSSLPRADAKSKGDAKPAKPTEPQKEKGNSQPQTAEKIQR